MKSYKVFILFPFLMASILATGQSYNRDSVHNILEQIRKKTVDTAQVRLLRELGYDIIESDSSLSKQILEEALSKSIQIGEYNAITNSYRLLGLWYSDYSYADKALELQMASLVSATKNQNLFLMAGANFNIGNIKYGKGEYDSCIEYFLKTEAIYDNPKIFDDKALKRRVFDKKLSDLYYNMSAVFNTLKNLPKADIYIEKAIAIAKSYKNADVIAFYMQQKADNYSENGETEKALRIRLENLAQLEKGNVRKSTVQNVYQNIAQEYFELNKTDSSKFFALKSLKVAEELNNESGMANANWQLGRIAMRENKFTEAENYLNKCSSYFVESEDPAEKRDYFGEMRNLMFAKGKYKEAYVYFEKFSALNDTLLNSERAKQFSDREAKYESEKKDNQIQLQKASLKQKNTLNYLLTLAMLLLIVIGLLMLRNNRNKQTIQRQRINELEAEKKLTATEAVLKGEEQERTRLAKDLHDGLGGMLSGIKYSLNTMKGNLVMTADNAQAFERSMDMLDSSIKEMRRVAHNMMPEALVKFGLDTALKDFCNDINQSGALKVNYQSIGLENATVDQTTAIAIYRIVQELINNTMKHAAAKAAIVQVSKIGGQLSVTVEDDGKGFDKAILNSARGIGWTNIQSRVDFLKGKLDVQSADGKGTSVHIELKA